MQIPVQVLTDTAPDDSGEMSLCLDIPFDVPVLLTSVRNFKADVFMNGWFVKDCPSQRQGDVSIGKVFATQV